MHDMQAYLGHGYVIAGDRIPASTLTGVDVLGRQLMPRQLVPRCTGTGSPVRS